MPKLMRAMFLLWLEIKAALRQVVYDLYREIVVLICTIILGLLFYHIFNDFLNFQLKDISPKLQASFGYNLHWFLAIAASVWTGKKISLITRQTSSLYQWSQSKGEDQTCANLYLVLSSGLKIIGYFGFFHLIAIKLIGNLPLSFLIKESLIMLVICFLTILIKPRSDSDSSKPSASLLPAKNMSTVSYMVFWRFKQMILKNRLSQISMACASLFGVGLFVLSYQNAPIFACAVWGLGIGFFIMVASALQISSDLEYAWMEKLAGVDHNSYMAAIERVAFIFATIVCSLTGLIWILGGMGNTISSPITDSLKIGLVSATPILTIPLVIFQIDARRPVILIMSATLISLLVGTAIFASWFGVSLIPLMLYYGRTSQVDRFYKAN